MNVTVDPAVIDALPGRLENVTTALVVYQDNVAVGRLFVHGLTRSCGRGETGTLRGAVFGFDGLLPDEVTVGNDRLYGDGEYRTGLFGNSVRSYLTGLVQVGFTELRPSWSTTVDGVTYTAQMGRFFLSENSFHIAEDDEEFTFTAFDVSDRMKLAGYQLPIQVARGSNMGLVLSNLVSISAPAWVSAVVPAGLAGQLTPRMRLGLTGAGNPWGDFEQLCAWDGHEPRVTATGDVEALPTPNVNTATPVWTVRDGAGGTVLEATRAHGDRDLVNTVVVRSQNGAEGASIWAVAEDNLPGSRSSVAKIGRRTVVLDRSKVDTNARAGIVANNYLRRHGGLVEALDLVLAGPVPHLEPGDVVTVQVGDLEVDDVFVVERVEFDFDPLGDTMVSVTRRIV